MKKLVTMLLAAIMLLSIIGCAAPETPAAAPAAPAAPAENASAAEVGEAAVAAAAPRSENWKVAVMYASTGSTEETYRSFIELQERYGEEHIIGVARPAEQESVISTMVSMVSDPDVWAFIDLQQMAGGTAGVEACKEIRPDVFYSCCLIGEDPSVTTTQYDISLDPYKTEPMAKAIVDVAVEMGAKTFVHYSFPRHMAIAALAARRDAMEKYCAEVGIQWIYETCPDPKGDTGAFGTQQFLLEDVPKKVEQYGEDTAFFGTNPTMMEPMIKAAVESGGIVASPNDPSPFLGYIAALGIEIPEDKANDPVYAVEATKAKLKEMGREGRCGNWIVPSTNLYCNSLIAYGAEYAQGNIESTFDVEALKAIMTEEIVNLVGESYEFTLDPMILDGVEYEKYLGFMMAYSIM